MSSSLSLLLAATFMEHFKQNIVHKQDKQPTVWRRYVDNVFSICPNGPEVLNKFLMDINNKKELVKFTMEQENNNSLPFPDVLITKEDIGYAAKVYKKPTHTNRYLNYHSNHNVNIKKELSNH
ncbi:uncharacterized protein [Diabrotica undecimpunctata]|uniref:uncharacterized protein n=1 Tax=Diabrotica undecimpunctata TaxID=50387 RepID=UPI003B63974F